MSPRKRKIEEAVDPFVRMRVGIFEHVEKGWMDADMFLAYTLMIHKSDWATGTWHGSATALAFLLGMHWSPRKAERVIADLVAGKYLVSKHQRGKTGNYDIIINNFVPTIGDNIGKKLRPIKAGFRNPLTGDETDASGASLKKSDDRSDVKSVAATAEVTTRVTTEVTSICVPKMARIQDVNQDTLPSVAIQDVSSNGCMDGGTVRKLKFEEEELE